MVKVEEVPKRRRRRRIRLQISEEAPTEDQEESKETKVSARGKKVAEKLRQ